MSFYSPVAAHTEMSGVFFFSLIVCFLCFIRFYFGLFTFCVRWMCSTHVNQFGMAYSRALPKPYNEIICIDATRRKQHTQLSLQLSFITFSSCCKNSFFFFAYFLLACFHSLRSFRTSFICLVRCIRCMYAYMCSNVRINLARLFIGWLQQQNLFYFKLNSRKHWTACYISHLQTIRHWSLRWIDVCVCAIEKERVYAQ